jgi:hypothetical protein
MYLRVLPRAIAARWKIPVSPWNYWVFAISVKVTGGAGQRQ